MLLEKIYWEPSLSEEEVVQEYLEYGSRLSILEGFVGHAEQCNIRVRRFGRKNIGYGKSAKK